MYNTKETATERRRVHEMRPQRSSQTRRCPRTTGTPVRQQGWAMAAEKRLPFCSRPRATHHSHASSLFSTAQSDRASTCWKWVQFFFFRFHQLELFICTTDRLTLAGAFDLSKPPPSESPAPCIAASPLSLAVGCVGGFDGTSFDGGVWGGETCNQVQTKQAKGQPRVEGEQRLSPEGRGPLEQHAQHPLCSREAGPRHTPSNSRFSGQRAAARCCKNVRWRGRAQTHLTIVDLKTTNLGREVLPGPNKGCASLPVTGSPETRGNLLPERVESLPR